MQLSPDQTIFWQAGPIVLNATIVYTWLVMAILTGGAWAVTRGLTSAERPSRWQATLEALVTFLREQIREITDQDPSPYLPFISTLFLFIVTANLISIVPRIESPTGSLSTTAGLALLVFLAVPMYGIRERGVRGYLKSYLEPTPIMLPFNIISEFSRTVALAIRLFGNVLSGRILVAIMVSIIPLIIPVALQVLGVVVGVIQAYIFAILATVYIASSARE